MAQKEYYINPYMWARILENTCDAMGQTQTHG